MIPRFDIAIVGAGMAGASLAAALADSGSRIVLIEAEGQPGYHATGRSAAFWTESYGGPGVYPLTAASGDALRSGGYLHERGALTIARKGAEARLDTFADEFAGLGVAVERLDRAGLEARLPGLLPEWSVGALEPDCSDIDVARLHQDYLAATRRAGAELWTRARLANAAPDGDGWLVACEDGRELRAGLLVNAAGAWADGVAQLAGVGPLGFTPFRRTIAQLRTAPEPPVDLPLVLDLDEKFYFKPEAGRLWLSPHDEVPSAPCDAAPEELAVAEAIERMQNVVNWNVERVEHKWAGLRTFAPDRLPVYGFDKQQPRFFWFAGQGGFGIQTAPAAAALAASLITGSGNSPVDPQPYSPGRFR
ncbi:FAD-binding oxidoreductase [Novosphingobium sp. TH158]|uniref:NAD(P)/FAD-dependent oxidoreductase n=1 Tax=Novosphingobium sp. TH158 TaxID=2067455 RepID=UPI000C7B6C1F|nr:FAD-binding oxidoreductase [Novosphingobium sp. TH158]PLK24374.1 FAD-dependent oxidoreductase [Novosphingobium sp. TH158]